MKDVLNKQIDDEKKKLDGVNQSLAKYNDLYKKRKDQLASAKSMGNSAGAASAQKSINGLQGAIGQKTAEQQDIMNVLDQLESGPGKAKIAKIVGGVAAVAGAVSAGFGLYQQSKTMDLVNQAAVTSLTANQAQQMLGGNFQSMLALQNPESMKRVQDAGGTGAIYGRNIAGILAKIGGGAGAGALMGGPLGALIGGAGGALASGSDIMGLFTGAPEKEAAESQQKALQSEVQKNAYGNFLLNYVKDNASSFVGAGRRLGGVTYADQAADMGRGLGFLGSQSAQMAGGFADQIGASGAQQNLSTFFALQKGRYGANMSAEGAGSLITGLSYGQEGRGGAGQAAVDFWSKAFSKGLTDAKIGEELGKSLAENMSGEGGRRSTTGFISNAFAGVGEEFKKMFGGAQMDRMSVGELNKGLSSFDTAFSSKLGGSFAAKNQSIARDIISAAGMGSGPNAEYYVSALSGLSTRDMAEGGNEGLLSYFGGDKDKMHSIVKQFKNRSAKSTIDLLFPTNAFGIKSTFDMAGGDMTKAFQSMDPMQRKQFSYTLQKRAPELGLDLRSGVMAELFYAADGNTKANSNLAHGKGKDLGASAYLAAQVSMASEEATVRGQAFSKKNIELLNKAMGDSVAQFHALLDILNVAPSALNNFTTALTVAQMRIEGKSQKEIDAYILAHADASNRPASEAPTGTVNKIKTETEKLTDRMTRLKL